MFIIKRATPNSPRKTVQIVETYRIGKKVRQKILSYIGVIMTPEDEKNIMALAKIKLAQLIKEQSAEKGKILTDEEVLLLTKKGKKNSSLLPKEINDNKMFVDLSSIAEEYRVIDGVDDIAGIVFDELGFSEVLRTDKQNKILKDVVLSRMIYSQSKLKLCETMKTKLDKNYTEDQIYRVMDNIYPKIDKIKKIIFDRTHSLMPAVNILLFDVTTLYCESIVQDDIRDFGFSKDGKINNTQIVLALATNEYGLPIGYELFPGNFAEVKTLFSAIKKWSKLFKINDACFIGDRAMFSEDNINLIEEHGYKYIIAAKLRSLSSDIQSKILDEKNYKEIKFNEEIGRIAEFKYKRERKIKCTFNSKDYGYTLITNNNEIVGIRYVSTNDIDASSETFNTVKDKIKKIRKYTLQCECLLMTENEYKLGNELFKDRAIIFNDKISYNGVIQNLDEITKKQIIKTGKVSNSLMKKLFKDYTPNECINIPYEIMTSLFPIIEQKQRLCVSYKSSRAINDSKKRERILSRLKPKEGNATNIVKTSARMYMATDGVTSLDSIKISEAEKWDGIHGVITNISNESPEEIITRYGNLWRIEEAFRINKHNLGMRPMFHHKKERIYSHIAICYIGFAILKLIQYQTELTQPRFTINSIIETLLSVESSICIDTNTKNRYKIPGIMSSNAIALYQAFEVKKTRKPIRIS